MNFGTPRRRSLLLVIFLLSLLGLSATQAQIFPVSDASRLPDASSAKPAMEAAEAIDLDSRPATTPSQARRIWQMTGPFGGDVASLAIDPRQSDRLFAGTHDGQLYRSTDGGVTWRRAKPGLRAAGYQLTVILFDRERPSVIYVGAKQIKDARDDVSGGSIFRSSDGGETWHELETMKGRSVRGLVQSAQDGNVLAAAARDGIYRTLDRGRTWQRITPASDPELTGFHSVAIDPRSIDTIYAGTWHLPWKTTDGGVTWKRAGSKETGMIDDSDIFAIHIDESNPDTVYMSACSGIYSSLNGGAKWTKLQGIPYTSRRTHVIYQHPTRPEVIFAGTTEGLWRTMDGGKTEKGWGLMTSRRLIINSVAVHPDRPDRVYLGTDDFGILISNDGGESYEQSNAGFINRQVRAVLADRTERGRIYAGVIFDGTNGGLFISEDGGISWQQSMQGMGVRDIYSLYQSETHPETIYVGTNHGLFRSDDHGRSWASVKRVEEAVPESTQNGSEPSNSPSATNGAVATRPRAATSQPAGVKRVVQTRSKASARQPAAKKGQPPAKKKPSTSKQASAKKKPAAPPVAVPQPPPNGLVDLQSHIFALVPFTPRSESAVRGLLAATWDGLFFTEDERKGWRQLKLELEGRTSSARLSITAVATSAHAPGVIFVGTEEGLFVSRDNGESFREVSLNDEPRRVRALAIDPRTAEMVYVGTANGFFRSTDGGRTWEQRGGGMRMLVAVSVLAINPSNPDELYLGDYNQGLFFHSRDRGKYWEQLEISALPSWRLWSLTYDPFDSNRLYAGSFSGGVYVMTKQPTAHDEQ
jgi:photosystem II stability/assembly factor-like uncharacterized protein